MAAVVGIRAWPRPIVLVCETLLVAVCYYAAGRAGLSQQLVADGAVVTPIWPPTGVAVACLLLFGLRCVPGIAVGALLVVASLTAPRLSAAGIVLGNTLAPVCACLMLRAVGFRASLSRLRDGLMLVFLGAMTAMLISSGAGVGTLVLTNKLADDAFWLVWLAWWVGDAMGVVIVTPLLLLLHRARWPPPSGRWGEAAGLALVVCVLVPLVTYSSVSVLFLVYPLLIWAALRFQLAGGMPCALFASVMATVAAREEAGSFARLTDIETMMKLQAFNGTLGLTALLLSSVISEQINTRRSVERACQELVGALQHLNAGGPGNTGSSGGGVR
ncbi:MASE1 domain-containing protein [Streptomyces sp. b94]|uniref:MASE1 domain-containing protein n=1 Tax=Streptomyces sp. b94 TaxID=1827634 RepID=UPI001B37FB9A|nr:MASE1 domain-containing protein [Streptomyces sp. b94]MBQ1097686.1 MASE1 domain-containing protein [Streptomyces sp. b94]